MVWIRAASFAEKQLQQLRKKTQDNFILYLKAVYESSERSKEDIVVLPELDAMDELELSFESVGIAEKEPVCNSEADFVSFN